MNESGNMSSTYNDCLDMIEPRSVSKLKFISFRNSLDGTSKQDDDEIDNSNIELFTWSTWLRFFEGLFLFLLAEISFFVSITEHATRLLLIMVPLIASVYLNKTGTKRQTSNKDGDEDSYRAITPLNIWFLSVFVFIVCAFIEYLIAFYSVQRIKNEVEQKRKSFKGFVADDDEEMGDSNVTDTNLGSAFVFDGSKAASNVKEIIEEPEEKKNEESKDKQQKIEDKKKKKESTTKESKDKPEKKEIVVPEPKVDPKQPEVEPRVVITADTKPSTESNDGQGGWTDVDKSKESGEKKPDETKSDEKKPGEVSKPGKVVSFIKTEKPETEESSEELPPPSVIGKKSPTTDPIELEDDEDEEPVYGSRGEIVKDLSRRKKIKKRDESPSMIQLATIRKKKRQEWMQSALKKMNRKLHLIYTISYLPADKTARITFPICFTIYCYFFWLVYMM